MVAFEVGAARPAITSGGAIPDTADYRALEPEGVTVGTLNEDFAIESQAGDIFQLGNTSWRILRVQPGVVRGGCTRPATHDSFWLGEAPPGAMNCPRRWLSSGRTSRHASAMATASRMAGIGARRAAAGAAQIVAYLGEALRMLGALPTLDTLMIERFFDESGGMQLRAARAVREPRERAARAAQALLPSVQLRASGSGHRGMRCSCR